MRITGTNHRCLAGGHGLRRRPKETREEVACRWWDSHPGCGIGPTHCRSLVSLGIYIYAIEVKDVNVDWYVCCITFLDKRRDMRMGQYHIPFRVGWTFTHRSYPQVVNSHWLMQNSEAILNIGYILAKHTWNHAFTICFDITVFSFVNHFPYFRTIGVTWVLFWKFGIVFCLCTLQHFCAAFSMGERLGLASWP